MEDAASEVAKDIVARSMTDLCLDLRFMTRASLMFDVAIVDGDGAYRSIGSQLQFPVDKTISDFREDPNRITRSIAHMILHSVLGHTSSNADPMMDLAEDMIVEYSLDMLGTPHISIPGRDDRIFAFERMMKKTGTPTAEAIASELHGMSEWQMHSLTQLFPVDSHDMRDGNGPSGLSEISKQMMVEIEGFSDSIGDRADALLRVLRIRNRRRYDHREFLRKFLTVKDSVKENPDEFDPAYYSYGLSLYGNIPLIDSVENSERHDIDDLAIAIDTSGSTMKGAVAAFITEVCSIMEQCGITERTNLHIIQCDELVRSDTVIRNRREMDAFIRDLELHGGKGTDFRPVFQYVDSLIENGTFSSLKGLLYFTDGFGTYPAHRPGYRTAFVFCGDRFDDSAVPAWAMKVVLGREDFGYNNDKNR